MTVSEDKDIGTVCMDTNRMTAIDKAYNLQHLFYPCALITMSGQAVIKQWCGLKLSLKTLQEQTRVLAATGSSFSKLHEVRVSSATVIISSLMLLCVLHFSFEVSGCVKCAQMLVREGVLVDAVFSNKTQAVQRMMPKPTEPMAPSSFTVVIISP